jgi:hypothetical protein
MQQYIDAIKNSINNILAKLKFTANDRLIRVSCVFFRDLHTKPDKILDEDGKEIIFGEDIIVDNN